jgi:hypothetical protein
MRASSLSLFQWSGDSADLGSNQIGHLRFRSVSTPRDGVLEIDRQLFSK